MQPKGRAVTLTNGALGVLSVIHIAYDSIDETFIMYGLRFLISWRARDETSSSSQAGLLPGRHFSPNMRHINPVTKTPDILSNNLLHAGRYPEVYVIGGSQLLPSGRATVDSAGVHISQNQEDRVSYLGFSWSGHA